MIHRALENKISALTQSFPVASLMGPRQSGKTTLVRAMFPDYAYRNLENLDDRVAAEEDPRRFLRLQSNRGLIVDEAQKVPALFSYIQGIVDDSGEMGKFVLTGSQNFLLLESIMQSLAGRVDLFNIMPLGLDELNNVELAPVDLNLAMFTGGYPVLYDRKIAAEDYFPSYIQTYIERDVRSISNIGDLSTFQRFVKLRFHSGLRSNAHFFLVYGGERNQSRKHGRVIGWKNIDELPYFGNIRWGAACITGDSCAWIFWQLYVFSLSLISAFFDFFSMAVPVRERKSPEAF